MKNNRDELEELLENMEQPSIEVINHSKEFRLTLLNTKKSALVGILLLILPFLFILGVIFKHYLRLDFEILTSVYTWIGAIDHKYGDGSILNWIIRFLLLGGPLLAILINLISVMHIRFEKSRKEIIISLKMKWLNWIIIAACSMIFTIFFLYLIMENLGR